MSEEELPWESVYRHTTYTQEGYADWVKAARVLELHDLRQRYEGGQAGRNTRMPTYRMVVTELARRRLLDE